jgi:hypothetical protein
MDNEIYFIKIHLLESQFKMSVDERRAVKRMADFIALYHAKAFLQSRIGRLKTFLVLDFLSFNNFLIIII